MKNMTTQSKTLLMTIITIVAAAFYNGGIPATNTAWIVTAITVVGTVLGYLGQNFFMPSVSPFGMIDWKDVLKGVFVGISAGVSNWIGNLVEGTAVDYNSLWKKMVVIVVAGYFAKNFGTQNPTK